MIRRTLFIFKSGRMAKMNKAEFASRIETACRDYETALATLDETQMIQPSTCGDWSVKDVIAHITWYEREMVGMIRQRALLGSDLWNVSLEQRNAAIFEEYKDRLLADILSDVRTIHKSLMELIQGLSDDDFQDASHFREMPPDWKPWEVIASNTFEHYLDHVADIRKAFPG